MTTDIITIQKMKAENNQNNYSFFYFLFLFYFQIRNLQTNETQEAYFHRWYCINVQNHFVH